MENRVLLVSIKGVIPTSNGCALFLGCSEKIFVIYMDSSMGPIIENAIRETPEERPQSHDLMQLMLEGLDAEVERVIINHVDQGTFYARLIISMENEIRHKIVEIDARPSDCIVLALLTKKPLYVAESVLAAVDDMSEVLQKILEQQD